MGLNIYGEDDGSGPTLVWNENWDPRYPNSGMPSVVVPDPSRPVPLLGGKALPPAGPVIAPLAELGRTPPTVSAPGEEVRKPHWYDFNKHVAVDTVTPGINAPVPAGANQTWKDAAFDPNTGQLNPASPGLTKLGKVFSVVSMLAKGAAEGSAGRNFGEGFQMADYARNRDIANYQEQQQRTLATQAARQNMEIARQQAEMVDTPYGKLPAGFARALLLKEVPARIAAESREDVADTRAQSAQTIAKLNNMTKEEIAKYNADNKAKLAGVSGIEVTPEFAKEHNIPPEFVGTKVKLTDLAALQRSTIFEDIPLQTATGPIIVNRKTGKARSITGDEGQTYLPPALGSLKETADLENPGQTKLVPGYQAGGLPGPQSASVQVPKAEMKAEVPKDIGVQKVAFNTALQHADLLESAMRYLDNGNWQALNKLENRFKNAFGYAGPITAQAIANAYTREVTTMLSKGHLTNSEIESAGSTIDPQSQNLEQVLGVLGAYRALSTSKLKMLEEQAQAAVDKSQPKKPEAKPSSPTKKATKASKYGVEVQ